MCGRFTLTAPADQVAALFGAADAPPLRPGFNVAPSQPVAAVGLNAAGVRRLSLLRWGFVPRWTTDPKGGRQPINARSETADVLPTFRDSFRRRRCLIPADGFYEWHRTGSKKVPHHFRPAAGGLWAFAGLWDVWHPPGGPKQATCCLLTTAANEAVRPVHERMPVILPPDVWADWLQDTTPVATLRGMLRPLPPAHVAAVAVGPAVNSPRNNGPECLQAA